MPGDRKKIQTKQTLYYCGQLIKSCSEWRYRSLSHLRQDFTVPICGIYLFAYNSRLFPQTFENTFQTTQTTETKQMGGSI